MNLTDLRLGNWSLFLDRDGVINKKVDNGYVTKLEEFEFLPGALEAVSTLSKKFNRTFIVTNQRGIFKGLYTVDTLTLIHNHLIERINAKGGRIDKIYFCPHDYTDHCICRKPAVGMALAAKADFSEIDFHKSIIIGDSYSDIQMGLTLNMTTVLISEVEMKDINSHFRFSSLNDFSKRISLSF